MQGIVLSPALQIKTVSKITLLYFDSLKLEVPGGRKKSKGEALGPYPLSFI